MIIFKLDDGPKTLSSFFNYSPNKDLPGLNCYVGLLSKKASLSRCADTVSSVPLCVCVPTLDCSNPDFGLLIPPFGIANDDYELLSALESLAFVSTWILSKLYVFYNC